MKDLNRRTFISESLAALAAVAVSPRVRASSTDNTVVVGVMGLGGRGTTLTRHLAGRSDVRIKYLCDVDRTRFAQAAEVVDSISGDSPRLIGDFRRMLDDSEVDAVIIATPTHWHALGTIMACQAGKDVYVEKPGTHNVWEGRKMVEAARKYERVVQVGLQCRSAPYSRKAVEYVRSGKLGQVYYARVANMIQDQPRPRGKEQPVPKSLDWDMWCGPAPMQAYSPGRWHRNFWDYSSGKNTDDLVHQLDMARHLLGRDYPGTVYHGGGVRAFDDGREIPDTQIATFEYDDGLTLTTHGTLWAHYVKKTPHAIRDSDQHPDWMFNSTRVELFGTDGMMLFGRHGGGWKAFDSDGELVASEYGRQSTDEHLENFFSCVRDRKTPNCDIEEGVRSALLCHLANVSYRVGNRVLTFDAESERFVGYDEANRYLKREYREPWIIPDVV
jgi:predicted dehydrogenase